MKSLMDIGLAATALKEFGGTSLTLTLSKIESSMCRVNGSDCAAAIAAIGANEQALAAAAMLKAAAGQINVAIHALGILLCLPHILERDELIEEVSLGAGNTGREHDLKTSHRIAEFKFIQWRGGPESIRQNSIFKDFFLLAENTTPKRKYLYVLGTDYPLKFFNGGRDLSSVLSKDDRLKTRFVGRFGDRFKVVRDYYTAYKNAVIIEDVSKYVSALLPNESQLDEEASI